MIFGEDVQALNLLFEGIQVLGGVVMGMGLARNKMKAIFVKTQGEYLEAEIEVDGHRLVVMDNFSTQSLKAGDEINLELSVGLYCDDEAWDIVFASNPKSKVGLEHVFGWEYKAYGVVQSVNPVRVNVGMFDCEAMISSNDERIIGEPVSFLIKRLDANWLEDT